MKSWNHRSVLNLALLLCVLIGSIPGKAQADAWNRQERQVRRDWRRQNRRTTRSLSNRWNGHWYWWSRRGYQGYGRSSPYYGSNFTAPFGARW